MLQQCRHQRFGVSPKPHLPQFSEFCQSFPGKNVKKKIRDSCPFIISIFRLWDAGSPQIIRLFWDDLGLRVAGVLLGMGYADILLLGLGELPLITMGPNMPRHLNAPRPACSSAPKPGGNQEHVLKHTPKQLQHMFKTNKSAQRYFKPAQPTSLPAGKKRRGTSARRAGIGKAPEETRQEKNENQ